MMKIWAGAINVAFLLPLFTGSGCTGPAPTPPIGQAIDSLRGVAIYYDMQQEGALQTMKFTSTEFVKRYYSEVMSIQLPDSLLEGSDFFDPAIPDGAVNPATGLVQYTKPSKTAPEKNDILVFSEADYNPGGHVAIIGKMDQLELEAVQQNPGPLAKTREPLRYYLRKKKWYVQHPHAVAWLRKE